MKHQKPLQYIATLAIFLSVTFTSCIDYGRQEPSTSKLSDLLHIIGNQYVDTVDMAGLIEKTIPKVLAELDPHSVYIPAKDAEESNQELRGSFSGIGIQFMIQSDTIYISDVISGGPSEKVGLMAGDRIVTIDDSLYVGKKISNDGAMKRLKGPKGSEVRLGIKRHGERELLSYTIVRGNIPVKSIDATYMIDDRWCYMKINKFGETTYPEMLIALAQGMQNNMQGCIVDLRGNTGGYMGAAIQMVNEFLPKGEMIVYTEGENAPRYEEYANGGGSCQKLPIVVLTDETSASASEIFAGAIQDNDRGTIVGRRTFGKGLVQQPIELADGSAIRLTIARYHTPSGRCIQKPYTNGKSEEYELDLLNRYEHGEFFTQDSIKQDESNVYTTKNGRTVYGGGGIMPDIFIPHDTAGYTSYYAEVAKRGLLTQYPFQYTDKNRAELSQYTTMESLYAYLQTQDLLGQLVDYATLKGVKRRNNLIRKSRGLMEDILYGNIIYNVLGMQEYVKYLNLADPTVLKAVEILDRGESRPRI
ncbi:MAG: S41 family peptidase [Bacteroidaceae bacterium]|nr:S41 family peptidase [Bacteroidaceae bacterium]